MVIKLIKNKKGMTIMELIVALMIFTVVAVSVTAILAPVINAYIRVNDLAEMNTLLDNLSAELLSDLEDAVDIQVSGSSVTIKNGRTTVVYDVAGGILQRGGFPVLDAGFYNGGSVVPEYIDDGDFPAEFTVRLTVTSAHGVTASRDYAVKALGLNTYD